MSTRKTIKGREGLNRRNRAYYERNREKVLERQRINRAKRKVVANELQRQRYERNQGKINEGKRARHHFKRKCDHAIETWKEIMVRFTVFDRKIRHQQLRKDFENMQRHLQVA